MTDMWQTPYFLRNIEYYIREAFIATLDVDLIPGYIIEQFKKMYIYPSDEKLLNLFFKENATQEDLDNFLSEWDIEEEGSEKALVLSHFMKLHPELKYPEYVEPRLNGLLKFFKYKNLILLSHFKKYCTALKKENIDIMIFKGGAFKHLNPEYSRIMCDIDILVPENDYEKAINIAKKLGYKYTAYGHSTDLYDPKLNMDVLDIHRKLDLQTEKDGVLNDGLFARASRSTVFNVDDIYIPSPEDMMFILLTNLTKNMTRRTRISVILHAIIDYMFLMNYKPDLDWDLIWEIGVETGTELQIAVAGWFINEYAPVKMPSLFDKDFYYKSILFLYDDVIEE